MASSRQEPYTHGEIMEKLDKVERHLKYLEGKHEASQIYTTGIAIFGFVFSIFALSYAVAREYALSFTISGAIFALLAWLVLRTAKKREEALGPPPE